jgi:hypothetical protein
VPEPLLALIRQFDTVLMLTAWAIYIVAGTGYNIPVSNGCRACGTVTDIMAHKLNSTGISHLIWRESLHVELE